MPRPLLACALLAFAASSPAHAGPWAGGDAKIVTTSVIVPSSLTVGMGLTTAHFFVRARVWTLMGEPVVYCDVAWTFNAPAFVTGPRTGQSIPIPRDVAVRVRAVDVRVKLETDLIESQFMWIPCDAGAMLPPYLDSVPLERLPQTTRDEHFSFNVPGSPDWSRLFETAGGVFVDAEQAKNVFGAGLALWRLGMPGEPPKLPLALFDTSVALFTGVTRRQDYGLTLLNVAFDFAALHEHVAVEEWRILASRRKEVEDQVAAERHAAETLAGDAFWSVPGEPRTIAQQERLDEFEKALREANNVIGQFREYRAALDVRLAAQRADLERRSGAPLTDSVCRSAHASTAACLERACGRPVSYFGGLVLSAPPPDGCDAACEERHQEQVRERERERDRARQRVAEAEARRLQCVESHRLSCAPEGFEDIDQCVRTLGGVRSH